MDLKEIRRVVIAAVFSDDELFDKLVLKGGNALDIVYNIGGRSSVDVDLSMADDFEDLDDARQRIFRSLLRAFAGVGYVVFDFEFNQKPSQLREGQPAQWGGYQIEFKIIADEVYSRYGSDLENLRRRSESVGPAMQRKFKIDISKFEFCFPKLEVEIDHHTIYVYSLSMIALEKLRAICQQMPDYVLRSYSVPRARDFLDVYTIVTLGNTRLATTDNAELLRNIFAAKQVPISLLGQVKDFRDFHRTDWDAVMQTTSQELEEFDFYFDFVLALIENLQSLGVK